MVTQLVLPMKSPKKAEARRAVGKEYWEAAEKRVNSPRHKRAIAKFMKAIATKPALVKATKGKPAAKRKNSGR